MCLIQGRVMEKNKVETRSNKFEISKGYFFKIRIYGIENLSLWLELSSFVI